MLNTRLEEFQQTFACDPQWAMEMRPDAEGTHRATLDCPAGRVQGDWAAGKAATMLSAVNKALQASPGGGGGGNPRPQAGSAAAAPATGAAAQAAPGSAAAVRAALKVNLEAFQQVFRSAITWELVRHDTEEQSYRATLTWPGSQVQGDWSRGKAGAKLAAVSMALAEQGGCAEAQAAAAAAAAAIAAAAAGGGGGGGAAGGGGGAVAGGGVAVAVAAAGAAASAKAALKERLEAFQKVSRCTLTWSLEQSPHDEQQYRAVLTWPSGMVQGDWERGKAAAQLGAVTKALESVGCAVPPPPPPLPLPQQQQQQLPQAPPQALEQQQAPHPVGMVAPGAFAAATAAAGRTAAAAAAIAAAAAGAPAAAPAPGSAAAVRATLKSKLELFQQVNRNIMTWQIEQHPEDEQQFRATLQWPHGGCAQGAFAVGKAAAKLGAVSLALAAAGADGSVAGAGQGGGKE